MGRFAAATASALVLLLTGASALGAGEPMIIDFFPRNHPQPASPLFFYWYDPDALGPTPPAVPTKHKAIDMDPGFYPGLTRARAKAPGTKARPASGATGSFATPSPAP